LCPTAAPAQPFDYDGTNDSSPHARPIRRRNTLPTPCGQGRHPRLLRRDAVLPGARRRRCARKTTPVNELVVRLAGDADRDLVDRVVDDVFDGPVEAARLREFLADPRHHLAIALGPANDVIGFASAVHYVHPDKPPQLFINEVGVAASWQGHGLATRLLRVLLDRASTLGCSEAWVLTDADNAAACALYRRVGGRAQPSVMFTLPVAADARPTGDAA
jgi:ribosomal protein S18 acetylase RimI-like enzyme